MNNNYYNFNPNPSFMRGPIAPPTPVAPTMARAAAPLPRISSLFSGARGAGAAAGAAGASRITFSGILNGASKTLGVINQAIPVFYQIKPVWNNAKTMFRVVKEINGKDNSTTNSVNNTTSNTNNAETIQTQKKEASSNAPTFFA